MGKNQNHRIMKAIVAGGTGLIGSQLLELLLSDTYYSEVIAVTRKPLAMEHPRLKQIMTDADTLAQHAEQLQADDVFCCLGTTIRTAGSQEAFRKVDYTYPLTLARLTREKDASQYLLVSALGADKHSRVFYNRVKGEVEEAIRAVGFPRLHILQPSLLTGPRKEKRTGEKIGQVIFRIFNPVIPMRYRAIESIRVARAMQQIAKKHIPGTFIHPSDELQKF
jgi:uncharacterized protein YbjT (DUF2867 family)